ncbi:MAG TPA: FKBP-type peptidyl-prolyl cis-trans isomerase [Candidatus Saccharimonadales bacterium]|nr:FKBP-type peptidyl-prolyl cis-trans isomerase [Candidatus Saccharimonadales bacterium]
MARKSERAFALFGALLFLLTTSAFTIIVIITLVQQHNKSNTGTTAPKDNSTTSQATDSTSKSTKTATTTDKYSQLTATNNLTGAKMEQFTPTSTRLTKLTTQDIKVGTGATVQPGDTISADYVGALVSNGVIFDASANHGGPQTFPLSGVIAGWSQGIPGMKVGGTRRLLIPSGLAYGDHAQSGIPADSDLVFDVTVTAISK